MRIVHTHSLATRSPRPAHAYIMITWVLIFFCYGEFSLCGKPQQLLTSRETAAFRRQRRRRRHWSRRSSQKDIYKNGATNEHIIKLLSEYGLSARNDNHIHCQKHWRSHSRARCERTMFCSLHRQSLSCHVVVVSAVVVEHTPFVVSKL